MRHQIVQWILLPNGLTEDGHLAASVFIAPRLRPSEAATLADFPDFVDWPAILAGLELEIVRPDGRREAPLDMSVAASSAWWAALFPATTTVRPFVFDDRADRPLVSYPVAEVLAHLRDRWATLAFRARDDLPVTSRHAAPIDGSSLPPETEQLFTLVDHFAEIRRALSRDLLEGVADAAEFSRRLRARWDDAARQARERRTHPGAAPHPPIRPFGSGGSPADALYALIGFHARPSHEEPKPFPATVPQTRDELAQAYDFHHYLSIVGDHPVLLRHLGLAGDHRLDRGIHAFHVGNAARPGEVGVDGLQEAQRHRSTRRFRAGGDAQPAGKSAHPAPVLQARGILLRRHRVEAFHADIVADDGDVLRRVVALAVYVDRAGDDRV